MKKKNKIFFESWFKVGDFEQEEKAIEMIVQEVLEENGPRWVDLILKGQGNLIRKELGILGEGFDEVWKKIVVGLEKRVFGRILECRRNELSLLI